MEPLTQFCILLKMLLGGISLEGVKSRLSENAPEITPLLMAFLLERECHSELAPDFSTVGQQKISNT